ncbi:hypothetical protein RJ639_004037 [Escallonia herrerae]|uniref:Uncharacterized protein n=1 Tax=Escallonia herrerae TaxID=1293975 RepID=A0AA88W5B5_9ASTE|nr:hypothetical protein RJ639_004037 [Escallonia herrerae]
MKKMLLRDMAIRHPKVIAPKCPPRSKDRIVINGHLFQDTWRTFWRSNSSPLRNRGQLCTGLVDLGTLYALASMVWSSSSRSPGLKFGLVLNSNFTLVKALSDELTSMVDVEILGDYFAFHSFEQLDLEVLLAKGTWNMNDILLSLIQLEPCQGLSHFDFSTVTPLIQLHDVPVEYFSTEIAHRLGSYLGEVVVVDWYEERQCRKDFICVLLKVFVHDPFVAGDVKVGHLDENPLGDDHSMPLDFESSLVKEWSGSSNVLPMIGGSEGTIPQELTFDVRCLPTCPFFGPPTAVWKEFTDMAFRAMCSFPSSKNTSKDKNDPLDCHEFDPGELWAEFRTLGLSLAGPLPVISSHDPGLINSDIQPISALDSQAEP